MISIDKDFNNPPKALKNKGWRSKEVKEALYELYHGKCAYTEQKLSFDEADVAYYRPLSKYPWLKNEWSNLLLVSRGINTMLANRFLSEKKQEPANDKLKCRADSKYLLVEEPVMIHPEVDTPENHFRFDRSGIISHQSRRAGTVIDMLALNTDWLRYRRKKYIDEVKTELDVIFADLLYGKATSKQKKDIFFKFLTKLMQAAQPESEFSLLGQEIFYNFRYFFRDLGSPEQVVMNEIQCPDIRGTERDSSLPLQDCRDLEDYSIQKAEMTRETSSGHKLKEELFKYYDLYIEQISGLGEIENKERNSFLPVAICGFSIRKFQGIKNLTQIGLPLSSSWIFLTGENGFGKTSLLRAILLGLAGDEGTGLTSDELDENARMVIHYKKNKDFRISAHRSNYFERLNAVAAYGSIRTRLEEYSSSKPKVTDSLFDKGTTLLNIEEKIKELDGSKSPVLRNTKKEIIKALKTVLPNLASIEVVENVNESKKELTYKEKSGNDTKTYREVSFREMAASMRSIIAMVGDIYLRLSKEKDVKDFNKLSGIVLIDELDLHLHPKWLKKLPGLLSEVFPKVQFIASTHSPIPLLGAPKGSVVLNVTRSAEKGIQVQRLDDKVYMEHLLPNTILTSPIFGMDDIISENRDKSVHIRYEDHYDDVKLNDVIRKKLDDYMNNEKEKELLNLIKKKNG